MAADEQLVQEQQASPWHGALRAGILGVAAALVALVVLQVSIAGAARTNRPQLALSWAPYDAHARAKLAGQLVQNESSPEARSAAAALALDAIRRDPLMPTALRALAFARADSTKPSGSTLALLTQSRALSRRDLPTLIWFIQHYGEEGATEAMMLHVDIALRSSPTAEGALFPLMAGLLSDRDLSTAVERRLRNRPEWGLPFLSYLATDAGDLKTTVPLLSTLLDPSKEEEDEIVLKLLNRLVDAGEYDLTWDLYRSLDLAHGGDIQNGVLIDGGFEGTTGVFPFAWKYIEDGDLWADPQPAPSGKGNALQLNASSGRSGEVARQLLKLAPGSYNFRAQAGDIPEDPFERPEVRVSCVRTDVERLALKPTSGGSAPQTIQGSFAIPAGCAFQWIMISIAGEGPPKSAPPWIDSIQVTRASQ